MKNFFLFVFTFFALALNAQKPDSSFFQQIDGSWYQVTVDYNDDGKLLDRSITLVGETGDSAEVAQLSFVGPINEASEWANLTGRSILGLGYIRNLISTYGNLWTQVTGLDYNIERSKQLATNFLQDADNSGKLDTSRVSLFLFGTNVGQYNLFQLNNGRIRLQSIDNPATQYFVNPWSATSFKMINVPVNDQALTKARLEALKAANPGLSGQVDACIAALGSLNENPVLVFTGEIVRQNGKKYPTFQSMNGRVRIVYLPNGNR